MILILVIIITKRVQFIAGTLKLDLKIILDKEITIVGVMIEEEKS